MLLHTLKQKHIILFSLLLMALFLAACSNNEASQPSEENSEVNQGEAEDSSTEAKSLRVRFYDDPSGFDPATLFRIETENIAFNLYSGLTSYDSVTGEIIPDLAESWESEGNKVWTFHLRQGVQWQKEYGEFTSADVVYSYERIMDPETASPYALEFDNIDSIEAPDDYTVVITLKSPDGNFLHQVANYHQGQIVKREAVEEFGEEYLWNPVGTGPYQLESFTPGSEIVLTRHEDYYKGPAPISQIVFSIIKDDETAAIALQNGEVDLAMRVSQEETLARLEEAGFKLNIREGYGIAVKMFNTEEVEPLGNPKVRQAWAHAIDWEAIINATKPSLQKPAYNLLPEWMDVYTDDVPRYEYDPEKAKQLLTEAGYPDGFTVTEMGRSSDGVDEASQLEQEYLAAVGINLEFELVDTPTNNQRRNSGDFEVSGRLLPAVNPDTILFSYLHPDNIAPKGLNGSRYNNPELTEKLEAARAETDSALRQQLYEEVQQIAMTDLPYIPTYANNVVWPGYEWVTGVDINGLAQVNFYGVDIASH